LIPPPHLFFISSPGFAHIGSLLSAQSLDYSGGSLSVFGDDSLNPVFSVKSTSRCGLDASASGWQLLDQCNACQ
jgi:hypothetical protein